MRAQKAGASGNDCPRPWHDYYRGDTEWKGKLILWRGHGISNTSWGPSPPTPTKSLNEGHVLQNCCGTAESCRSITLRERRETDRICSAASGCVGFSSTATCTSSLSVNRNRPQRWISPLLVLGGELSLRDNAGEAGMVAPRRVHAISISRTPIS
jgi:hypothetical protein